MSFFKNFEAHINKLLVERDRYGAKINILQIPRPIFNAYVQDIQQNILVEQRGRKIIEIWFDGVKIIPEDV